MEGYRAGFSADKKKVLIMTLRGLLREIRLNVTWRLLNIALLVAPKGHVDTSALYKHIHNYTTEIIKRRQEENIREARRREAKG